MLGSALALVLAFDCVLALGLALVLLVAIVFALVLLLGSSTGVRGITRGVTISISTIAFARGGGTDGARSASASAPWTRTDASVHRNMTLTIVMHVWRECSKMALCASFACYRCSSRQPPLRPRKRASISRPGCCVSWKRRLRPRSRNVGPPRSCSPSTSTKKARSSKPKSPDRPGMALTKQRSRR
jgi:hypothetical protein